MATYQWCNGPHASEMCQVGNPMMSEGFEQAYFVGNNQFGNTYNPNWRNHPNFSWWNNQGMMPMNAPMQQGAPPQEKKDNLEELVVKIIENTDKL